MELAVGMRPKSLMITKQEMDRRHEVFVRHKEDGSGKVTAICRYYVPDMDDPDGARRTNSGFVSRDTMPAVV